jgi:DNA-binding response OmpR family regulator
MQIIASSALESDDIEQLAVVCTDLGLMLRQVEEGTDVRLLTIDGPVMGVIDVVASWDTRQMADRVDAVRGIGALPIAVLETVDAGVALRVAQAGYALWLTKPLPGERVKRLLTYVRDATPPDSAVVLTLDEAAGTLRVGDRSTPVAPEEAVLLRAWAEHPGRIVSAETLPPEVAERMRSIAGALRGERFPAIGSAARIITVPGIGYRLLGTVAVASPKPLSE